MTIIEIPQVIWLKFGGKKLANSVESGQTAWQCSIQVANINQFWFQLDKGKVHYISMC